MLIPFSLANCPVEYKNFLFFISWPLDITVTVQSMIAQVRRKNNLLYMEDSDIKEVGSHDELMSRDGKYAALYNSQFA